MFDWVEVLWCGCARVRNCCKDFPLLVDAHRDLALIDVCNDQHDLRGEKKARGCCRVCFRNLFFRVWSTCNGLPGTYKLLSVSEENIKTASRAIKAG